MKKKRFSTLFDYKELIKTLIVMKFIFMLLLLTSLQSFSNTYSQDSKLTLNLKNTSIEDALKAIENQSDYRFLYHEDLIKDRSVVTYSAVEEPISQILSELLDGTDNSYTMLENNLIVIIPGEVELRQANRITGSVTDNQGVPLPGVTIQVKGTMTGGISGADGNYSVNIPQGSTALIFSFVGYTTQEIPISNRMVIDVVMEEEITALDEVVVVGYGVQRKSDVTGAISSIKSDDLVSRANVDVVGAMAGKTAGVSIVSTSGAPGQAGTVLIRGYASNQSSYPLYVIDGLRVNNISNLDPNTIESIEVLKDASSAAIYGAEAGNGVILITTKKGSAGSSNISYEFQYTLNNMVRSPESLNAEEFADWLLLNGKYTQSDINATITAGLWDGKSTTDWMDVMTEQGVSPRHTLSFQGGNDKGNYYLSLGNANQNGIVVGDYDIYKRINATLNGSYKFLPWLEIGNNTNFMHNSTRSVAGGNDLNSSFFGYIYYFDPTVSVTYSPDDLPTYMQSYLDDGKVILTDENGDYYGISQLISTNPCNPWAKLKSTETDRKSLMVSGTAYATITPLKSLTYTTRMGYNILNNNAWDLNRVYYASPSDFANDASVSRSLATSTYYQWENFINYDHKFFDAHSISAMLGMSYSQDNMYNMFGSQSKIRRDVQDNPLFWDLAYKASDSNDEVTGTYDWRRKLSYYGRLNYNYKDRYIMQFTLRADAADLSVLSEKNRWGKFPAVSLGWQTSNEPWFPRINGFDYMKIRATWGQNGSTSSLSNYSYNTSIATNALGYSFDGSNFTVSAAPSGLSNDLLKWETSEQLDFGIDLRFLQSRLAFSADWFNKTTKDLILSTGITVPASAGANAPVMNGGEVINRGWELEASWKDNIGDLGYSVNANFSTLHNEVTAIHSTVLRYSANSLQSYGNLTAFEVGHPVWYIWAYHSEGIDPATGNAIITDQDNNGLINVEDKIEAGSGLPDYQYGLTLSASYKNISLTAFGQGVGGNQIFRATGPYQQNTLKYFYDRTWTPEKAATATMAPMNSGNYQYYIVSDAYVFDADYFKIKQIQLGYKLPESITSKARLKNIQLYVSLEDWFCFTKYKVGIDPSTSANNSTGIGIDYGSYPNYKKTVFGINVSF